jgi:fructose-1-phosphate kinase PfkB-like protein
MDNKQEFVKELRELLQKYNVSIAAGECPVSDAHGIYDKHMEIYSNFDYQTILTVDGWTLDQTNLDIK